MRDVRARLHRAGRRVVADPRRRIASAATFDGSRALPRARSDPRSIAIVVTAMMPWPHIVLQPSLCMNRTPACASRRDRLGQKRAVHVGVPARLEHQRAAQMIELLHAPRRASRAWWRPPGRQALDDEPQRLAGRVGIDRSNAMDHGSKICDYQINLRLPDAICV